MPVMELTTLAIAISQAFYLTRSQRRQFEDDHFDADGKAFKAYEFYQNPGEAVFIPAGCVHQVCNLESR